MEFFKNNLFFCLVIFTFVEYIYAPEPRMYFFNKSKKYIFILTYQINNNIYNITIHLLLNVMK